MKRYEQGSVGMRPDPEGLWCDYAEAQAEIERLRGLVDACSVYLKEDETPAQRIERERADTEAVLKLLLKDRREIERLRGLLREGLGEHVRLHVHPHFPAWEKRVRDVLGEGTE